jgi:Fe-S-cluster-containing hydrogenase component 2
LKKIKVELDKCSGCRVCEIVCSYVHTKSFRPFASRITVLKDDVSGMDYPVVCHQCSDCKASRACSSSAITREQNCKLKIDYKACIGCGACVKACKYSALKMLDEVPIICDLCNDSPACVSRCPTRSLSYVEDKTEPDDPEQIHRKLMTRWGIIV